MAEGDVMETTVGGGTDGASSAQPSGDDEAVPPAGVDKPPARCGPDLVTKGACGSPDNGQMSSAANAVYSTEVALRWSDMDAYGHVNNVQYLRLLEDARISAFDAWFGAEGGESMLDSGVIVARQEIEYLRPAVYRREPLQIDMWVTSIGGASFGIGYEIRDPERVGDALYARAQTTLAAFDLTTERPRRLPATERAALEAHLGGPVAFRRANR